MPAVREVQAQDRVAGLEHREHRGRVGLRARVRLDVSVLGAEQLLGAVDRQLLDDVDMFAAAVVAAAWVTLGVLVGQHGTLRLEHAQRGEVLGRDHLQGGLLAVQLGGHRGGDLRVHFGQVGVEHQASWVSLA